MQPSVVVSSAAVDSDDIFLIDLVDVASLHQQAAAVCVCYDAHLCIYVHGVVRLCRWVAASVC